MKKEGNWLLTTMITLLLILSMIPLISNTVTAVDFNGTESTYGICGQRIWVDTSAWEDDPREYVQLLFAPNMTGHGSGENAEMMIGQYLYQQEEYQRKYGKPMPVPFPPDAKVFVDNPTPIDSNAKVEEKAPQPVIAPSN